MGILVPETCWDNKTAYFFLKGEICSTDQHKNIHDSYKIFPLITTNLQQYPNSYVDDCDSSKITAVKTDTQYTKKHCIHWVK
jgi:hypothetical protein